MKSYKLTLTVTHSSLDMPEVHIDIIKASSMEMATKHFKISNEQRCYLKNMGECSWIDEHGAMHKLELKEHEWKPQHQEQLPGL